MIRTTRQKEKKNPLRCLECQGGKGRISSRGWKPGSDAGNSAGRIKIKKGANFRSKMSKLRESSVQYGDQNKQPCVRYETVVKIVDLKCSCHAPHTQIIMWSNGSVN